jgi:exonuclease SbcC
MELQVLDQDLGGAARGVNSLSGGETFLVSLGLALGLSGLAARAARVESLFVDEGFGTLDSESLDQAMAVLEGLRATGRTVGIISHVPELHDRIGVLIQVEKIGAGRSRVRAVRTDEGQGKA